MRQESERGRPQNPFQSPEQISFPFSGLSVLASSLPLLATLFLILFGMPHALCSVLFRQGGTFPFISYSSLGPPAVFVAGSPRSHSDSVTWPQIAISRLPPWLPHLGHLFLLGGEPFVSAHGHLLPPSLPPSAAADLSGSGLARVTSPPKWEREEGRGRPTVTSNDARGGVRCVCARGTSSRRNRTSERGNERALWLGKGRR